MQELLANFLAIKNLYKQWENLEWEGYDYDKFETPNRTHGPDHEYTKSGKNRLPLLTKTMQK